MWYNLYLFFSMLTSFLESTHIATSIINQNMHVYTGVGQLLETSMGIEDLTSSLSDDQFDVANFPKMTVDIEQRRNFEMPDFSKYVERVSEKKCMEYIYEMLKRQEDSLSERDSNLTIINGKEVKAAEYPHMGALGWWTNDVQRKLSFLCGASLISDQFLLTAAHCKSIIRPYLAQLEPSVVRLGTRYLENAPNYEKGVDFEIESLICYFYYYSPLRDYDIALVKLRTKVQFTKFIQPACLSTRTFADIKKRITATGWGSVTAQISDMSISRELRFTEIHIFDDEKCNYLLDRYKYRLWRGLRRHQLCAGELDGNSDTCQGDSGGPIQYPLISTSSEGTIHRILAITSFGLTRCAKENAPGIYTRIAYFINWIENVVWPYEQLS
ncbi:clotting factor G beta subunit [Bicyclus anynana]|uniref:Clotting factor G beta subunit n=1 Tax=Bicyclus anynana TaxID=110368 RepID=A0A6J1MTV8_BICAN|nr:clotting factor G beta subunit [Bicyclus anynana]